MRWVHRFNPPNLGKRSNYICFVLFSLIPPTKKPVETHEPSTNNQLHSSHLDISRFQGLNIGLKTHRITDTWDSQENHRVGMMKVTIMVSGVGENNKTPLKGLVGFSRWCKKKSRFGHRAKPENLWHPVSNITLKIGGYIIHLFFRIFKMILEMLNPT